MPILQAPPTCAPVTHRVAALARGDGESRLSVPLASAGPQPGDLKRTVVEAIRVRHYSRSGTCDRHLCASCATEVGPDRHLCPAHATSGFAVANEAPPVQGEMF